MEKNNPLSECLQYQKQTAAKCFPSVFLRPLRLQLQLERKVWAHPDIRLLCYFHCNPSPLNASISNALSMLGKEERKYSVLLPLFLDGRGD